MEEESAEESRPLGPQILIAIAFFMSSIVSGLAIGHSAIFVPQLQAENSTIVIDENMGSWIVSLYSIIGPVGCLVSGMGSDWFGRRTLCLVATTSTLLGWILLTFAQDAVMILCGRVFEGLARSSLGTVITIYNHELSDPKYRGFLIYAIYSFIYVGILAISTFGTYLPWRLACGIAGILTLFSLVLFCLLPESPTWYAKKNKNVEAERALSWLWGSNKKSQIREELYEIIKSCKLEEHDRFELKIIIRSVKRFFKPHILKPFFILHFFNTIQVFCGLGILTFYTIDLLCRMRGNGLEILDDSTGTIAISAVRLIVSFLASGLTFVMGRRVMAMISGIFSFIPALIIGVLLYMETGESDAEAYLKLILLFIFVTSMTLGFNALPSIMISETQNAEWRAFVCGYFYAVNDLSLGGMLKIYPLLIDSLHLHGIFLMFGVACAVCTVFVYLFLPETTSFTTQEMEDYFKLSNVMWITRPKTEQRTKI